MKCVFIFLFSFCFSASVYGVEVLFDAIDVDGINHVGRIVSLDADSIRLATESGKITLAPERVELVQNLAINPYLLTRKQTNNTDAETTMPRKPTRQILDGNRIIVENGMQQVMRLPVRQNRNPNKPKGLSTALIERIRNAANIAKPEEQKNRFAPQFPESVIVIDLRDGSRLVATSLTTKSQIATCQLLDQSYKAEKIDDKKNTLKNRTANDRTTNIRTDENKTNENKTVENKTDDKIIENKIDADKVDTDKIDADKKNMSAGIKVSFPFDQIYAVRFAVRSLAEISEPSAEWIKQTIAPASKGDQLIIGKGGEIADVYTGIVLDITANAVVFSMDDEKLPVPRSKIIGMILHTPDRDKIKRNITSRGQINLWTGTQIILDSFELADTGAASKTENDTDDAGKLNSIAKDDSVDDNSADDNSYNKSIGKLAWKSLAGFSGEVFLYEVESIIFSRGGSLYLWDIVPVIRERVFPFEWNSPKSESATNSPLAMLRSFNSNQLELKVGVGGGVGVGGDPSLEFGGLKPAVRGARKSINQPVPSMKGVVLDGISYQRGIAVTPKTTIEYDITTTDQTYSAIRGFVGIDDRLKPNGFAKLSIKADNETVCSIDIRGTDAAKLLRYDLPKSHKKITITVDFADNITESTPISFGDLKLIK
ncbi:MAG: NPCBM/NEW2 domain-containing protein [Planctomycetaceae bacterium]|jgi:hypothetical protein|nr:NPCBM/NEW2 domain-containing protein [Planctomycetaceae bacterium]